jgi:hypothetical protein
MVGEEGRRCPPDKTCRAVLKNRGHLDPGQDRRGAGLDLVSREASQEAIGKRVV